MRTSIGTGVVLMAIGAVIAFAVRAPAEVEEYVDVLDLGLILMWSGVLVLIMQVVMHRPRRRVRRTVRRSYADPAYDEPGYTDPAHEDPWETRDVHRPGYAGDTDRLPTVRGNDLER